MKRTADWWAKAVAELDATGDTAEVAWRHGVRTATLIWWRSELRKRARGAATPKLLPVVVRESSARAALDIATALEVVVEIGAARVTMRGAVSPEHLAAVVSAAARTC